eukprot:GHVQ01035633.1.p1 GENE.GHVQ01035633.1~~GHVQ01035633.1.p1  ORF type:complete len:722 (-),score=120.78 GHVQ01035633.1:507-2672(-)
MVKVSAVDVGENYSELVDYLSEDSDEGDEDLLNKKFEEIEPLVGVDDSFPNVVVVVGVPKVNEEKYDKLKKVLHRKVISELQQKGAELSGDAFTVDMPLKDSETQGLCFLSFQNAYEAQHAVKHLNNFDLDLKHKFKATLLDDFDDIVKRDENCCPPIKLLGFTREQFCWWLHDPACREQYVIRHMDETEIFWHAEGEPVLVYNGERERAGGKRVWTDFRVQWSPQGSYLATFHKPGIALWAGPHFDKKVRFEHKDVKQIEFSRHEEYLVTWDGSPASLKNERACRVWRIITGELVRFFATPSIAPRGGDFPHLLWSPDDKYVAKCSDRELFVYATPDMALLEDPTTKKRSTLKYPLANFDWSPGGNILSIWIPEVGDAPGRLLLVEVPSREEVASKNVFNVREASLKWQSKGDYLCLRAVVARKTGKKGRKEYTQLEIFRLREKNIPVDTVHIEDVVVKQLHWEEGSNRFSVMVEDEATRCQSIRFYRVSQAGARRDTEFVASYDCGAAMNFMKWGPHGTFFVVASLGTDGSMLFCALNEFDKFDILHKDEHYMVNDISWSSCGRYVASCVRIPMIASGTASTAWRYDQEAGYTIWTFQGRLQYKAQLKKFYQFQWRPRPVSLLGEPKLEDIQKRLRDYSKKYDSIDEQVRAAQKSAHRLQRQAVMQDFQAVLDRLQEWKEAHALYDEWAKAHKAFDEQFEWDDKDEVNEEILDVQETLI